MRQIENKHQNICRNLPISIITLNINGLDAPSKRQTEIAKLDKRAGLNYVLPTVDMLKFIDIKTFKIKG